MTTQNSQGTTPGLRFDKVALRLVQGVRDALNGAIPNGLCVLFTVTAPIRRPSKTTNALVEAIRLRLSVGAGPSEHAEALYGNEIRVRFVSSPSPHAARIVGFVHNPHPPPDALLNAAQLLLDCVEPSDIARNGGPAPDLETLRRVQEQIHANTRRLQKARGGRPG